MHEVNNSPSPQASSPPISGWLVVKKMIDICTDMALAEFETAA